MNDDKRKVGIIGHAGSGTSKAVLLAAMAELITYGGLDPFSASRLGMAEHLNREIDQAKIEKDKEEILIKQYKSRGLKEFFYGENSVWASNQKNADRKAKRKNYI